MEEIVTYVVLENHPADSRVKICEDGIFQTLNSRMGTGGGNVPMVLEIRTVQKTTGTLSPGAHAGSYNGQDAYNDLLVVDHGNNFNEQSKLSHKSNNRQGGVACSDGLQRSADGNEGGGVA